MSTNFKQDTQVAIMLQVKSKKAELKVQGLTDEAIQEQVVQMTIFNHGVNAACEFFGLPRPRITSIFYRTDCWARCLVAAKQMIAKGK